MVLWLDGRRRSARNAGGAVYPLYPAGVPLQESISRPRWLLGRTWGQSSDSLKLEGTLCPRLYRSPARAGARRRSALADFSEAMGHAGAIVRHPNGLLEGATDPRSNGAAAGY